MSQERRGHLALRMALTLHRTQEAEGTEEPPIQPPDCTPPPLPSRRRLSRATPRPPPQNRSILHWPSLPTSDFLPTLRPKPTRLPHLKIPHLKTKEQKASCPPSLSQPLPPGLRSAAIPPGRPVSLGCRTSIPSTPLHGTTTALQRSRVSWLLDPKDMTPSSLLITLLPLASRVFQGLALLRSPSSLPSTPSLLWPSLGSAS